MYLGQSSIKKCFNLITTIKSVAMKVSNENETGFQPINSIPYVYTFKGAFLAHTTLNGALNHVNGSLRCQRLDVTNG